MPRSDLMRSSQQILTETRRPGRARRAVLAAAVVGLGALGACSGSADGVSLIGTGASFPAPLYVAWTDEYTQRVDPDVRIDYTAKGSSGGIKDVTEELVDFAGSDRAMSDDQLAAVADGTGRKIRMLPMTAGGVVVVYRLAEVDELRVSRDALAGIYLGEVTRWNDPVLTAANPGVELPDREIFVVRRAEGSGTTYAFTNHLAAISPKWREKYGASMSPDWPVGVGGKKNDGVAALVQQTPGSIGYVELSFARSAGLDTARLQNAAGNYVEPSIANFQAALASSDLPDNMRLFLPDPAGATAWPIVTYSWMLVYDRYPADKLEVLRSFLRFCLGEGQSYSEQLGYVPLPENVTARVLDAVGSLAPVEG